MLSRSSAISLSRAFNSLFSIFSGSASEKCPAGRELPFYQKDLIKSKMRIEKNKERGVFASLLLYSPFYQPRIAELDADGFSVQDSDLLHKLAGDGVIVYRKFRFPLLENAPPIALTT